MGLMDFSLEGVGELITSTREAITGKKIIDPTKLAMIDLQLQQLGSVVASGQMKINEKEASHSSVFVSGARPFILWTCGLGLAYASLLEPQMRFIAMVIFDYTGEFPVVDTEITFQVLLGMLGLGGMRSYEKSKGIHKNSL